MVSRALHFVYKISNRAKTIDFYRNVLNMKCLRHEEFEEGCKASCNGPYDGKWSKSMFGYGDEDNNFVVELTYNYGIRDYKHGNDYNYLEINSSNIFNHVKTQNNYNFELSADSNSIELYDPNGYKFKILNTNTDQVPIVSKLSLFSSNVNKSEFYWNQVLGMKLISKELTSIQLSFGDKQAKLEFIDSKHEINHETAFGRIAFSCETNKLESIQSKIDSYNGEYKVLTRLVSLDTPGKATVHVVILADPDGHEICFVGDEGFRSLSKIDPNGDSLLNTAINNDKSDEWFEKKNKKNQS